MPPPPTLGQSHISPHARASPTATCSGLGCLCPGVLHRTRPPTSESPAPCLPGKALSAPTHLSLHATFSPGAPASYTALGLEEQESGPAPLWQPWAGGFPIGEVGMPRPCGRTALGISKLSDESV